MKYSLLLCCSVRHRDLNCCTVCFRLSQDWNGIRTVCCALCVHTALPPSKKATESIAAALELAGPVGQKKRGSASSSTSEYHTPPPTLPPAATRSVLSARSFGRDSPSISSLGIRTLCTWHSRILALFNSHFQNTCHCCDVMTDLISN